MSEKVSYSSTFEQVGQSPKLRGAYFIEEAHAKGLALMEAKAGDTKIFWLINPENDMIVSAKHFTYGGPNSIAVNEAYCALVIGLNVSVAVTVTGEEVERTLRDEQEVKAAPSELFAVIDKLREVAKAAYPEALALIKASSVASRITYYDEEYGEKANEWLSLGKEEWIKTIEAALNGQIRDYLNSEGGDVEVIDVIDGKEVLLSFQGMCGTCASSTGSTLFAIEQALRENVYQNMVVTNVNIYG